MLFEINSIFEGYNQDGWVELQEYQMQNWQDLLITWRQLNLQIANLMYITEEDIRIKARSKHNPHKIAFNTVPEDQATTLGYFMEDYVLHLRHHLGQIRTIISSDT